MCFGIAKLPAFPTALPSFLLSPTARYFILLLTTLPHFSPHHKLIWPLVKRKTQLLLKKVGKSGDGMARYFAAIPCGRMGISQRYLVVGFY
jgi:hypothetical protein